MKNKKKYSLNERINYYFAIGKKEWKKYDKTQKMSNKLNYAMGYTQGASRGLSLNYDSLDKYRKLGELAGNRARLKSKEIKF